jgi:predicted ArsR family transcriptional regulator
MPDPTPLEIDAAFRAFRVSSLRIAIIRETLARGVLSLPDLSESLRVGRTTLRPHKDALVASGILLEQRDPTMAGARSGFNRLVYRVDDATLRRHLEVLSDAALNR